MTDRLSEIRERLDAVCDTSGKGKRMFGLQRHSLYAHFKSTGFNSSEARFLTDSLSEIRYLLDEVERLQEAVKSHQKVIGLYLDVYGPTGGQSDAV